MTKAELIEQMIELADEESEYAQMCLPDLEKVYDRHYKEIGEDIMNAGSDFSLLEGGQAYWLFFLNEMKEMLAEAYKNAMDYCGLAL
jgi:hypothetical protein